MWPVTCISYDHDITQVEIIDKKEFAKVTLTENSETFIIYIVFLALKISIHLTWTD